MSLVITDPSGAVMKLTYRDWRDYKTDEDTQEEVRSMVKEGDPERILRIETNWFRLPTRKKAVDLMAYLDHVAEVDSRVSYEANF